ncbi:nucleotide-binding protein [Prunus dulcis]|uniref:Nucleotide-binding protein n=1 Tax=Prunus dulcis TaxID=3755 RepID=A0A4Y1R6B3_PRUDU|nr:nucleotide-binding protein [Prunus dulcis]
MEEGFRFINELNPSSQSRHALLGIRPMETYVWKKAFRSAPEQSFEWATYTVVSVRFNTGQPDILATSASIALYDSRMGKPRRRSLHEDKKCNHHHTNGKSKYSPTESLEMDLKIIWRVKGSG